jgi:GntR family transcriptional repressor for pyruvate dehydrogenase complex
MTPYSTIKEGSLVDQVFKKLREEILTGKLRQGDRLPPQTDLACQFGVSRTVVREAQNKLSSLGLLRITQGRGTFVLPPESSRLLDPVLHALYLDETSIRELFETRYHLERISVELAAKRCAPQDAARLEELWMAGRKYAEQGDHQFFSKMDVAFHCHLAAISQNRMFCRILDTIGDMNYRFLLSFTQTEGAIERAVDFHRRIMEAVVRNDPDEAVKEMSGHLTDIMGAVQKHYRFDLAI